MMSVIVRLPQCIFAFNRYGVIRSRKFTDYLRTETAVWIKDVVDEIMSKSAEEDKQEERLTALVTLREYKCIVITHPHLVHLI
jgi:hypothetical protein